MLFASVASIITILIREVRPKRIPCNWVAGGDPGKYRPSMEIILTTVVLVAVELRLIAKMDEVYSVTPWDIRGSASYSSLVSHLRPQLPYTFFSRHFLPISPRMIGLGIRCYIVTLSARIDCSCEILSASSATCLCVRALSLYV